MGVLGVTGRLLAVVLFARPCVLGSHLAAFLLVAAEIVIVCVRLLPVLVPVGIVGTALFLMALIAVRVWQTGGGCRPMRRASA
jgi:hypothetical protein